VTYDTSTCVYVSEKLRISSVYAHSCTVVAFLFTNRPEDNRKNDN